LVNFVVVDLVLC